MKIKHIVITLFILSFTISSYATSKKTYGDIVISRLINVYDGDTFRVDIDSYPPIVGKNISIRVYGIDTPEIRGTRTKDLAELAKTTAKTMLENAKVIELRDMRRGKYFRIIADVWIDGKNMGELLIQKGLAKSYFGGKRAKW